MKGPRPLVGALCLALLAVGCSTHHGSSTSATPTSATPSAPTTSGPSASGPSASGLSPAESTLLQQGVAALWPLNGQQGAARSLVRDLGSKHQSARVVGGFVSSTSGVDGTKAFQFERSGRIVTPVTSGISSDRSFTIEFDVRNDACVTAWGRVLGTTAQTSAGREGFEVIHYPSDFAPSACEFGVELWHRGSYQGGCSPHRLPTAVWQHWAITYSRDTLTCVIGGTSSIGRFKPGGSFLQPGPLGIGGSGSGFQGPADGISLSDVVLFNRVLNPAELRADEAGQ